MIEKFIFDETELIDSMKAHGSMNKCIIAIEECSELQKAITKIIRDEVEEPTRYAECTDDRKKNDLAEEIADVLISIESLKQAFNISSDDIQAYIDAKQHRQTVRDRELKLKHHSGR